MSESLDDLYGRLDALAAELDGDVRTYTEDGQHVCELVHNPSGDIERVRGIGPTRGAAAAACLAKFEPPPRPPPSP